MLEGHFKSIVPQLLELIRTYGLIADINTPVETRKIDIDPIWVLGNRIEKTTVPDNIGVNGILEGIWEPRLIKDLVLMPGEIDLEIAPPLGSVNAIT